MENDLLKISKRFFSRYLPILLILTFIHIYIGHLMGFNAWGLSVLYKFLFFCLHMSILFIVFVPIRHQFKPEKFTTKLLTAFLSLLISYFLYACLSLSIIIFFKMNVSLPSLLQQRMLTLLNFIDGVFYLVFFHIAEKSYLSEKKIQEEQLKRFQNEKKIVESKLKLLQAQIEPHFLFNTLTAVVNSYDTDINQGKIMLLNFIRYLRSSLIKMRTEKTTVKQELDLITAYLDIFCVRMGKRLHYTIDVPENIKHIEFPPMLIQPLVENAIKHGLEPKIEGGEISIRIQKIDNILRWEIIDTGLGFSENSGGGFGRKIVEERIDSLFGVKGRLGFEENQPSGVKVILEVPID